MRGRQEDSGYEDDEQTDAQFEALVEHESMAQGAARVETIGDRQIRNVNRYLGMRPGYVDMKVDFSRQIGRQ